jgi:putative MATE family efflux protein
MVDLAETRAASLRPAGGNVPKGVLSGPILPVLLGLALPTTIVLVVQTLVGVVETWFLGFLGTETLAGVTLVFPVLMLMQMMANGGMGGGVAAAVARARGAGRNADADALVWHAVILALVFGAGFSVALILGGPWLYRSMGGTGQALTAALIYSGVVFAGSIPIWVTSLLSAALRGAGNMRVPAIVTLSGFAILLPLSPVLIFGWGPFPQLGVAGGGVAVVVYYLLATLALLYLRSPASPVRLRIARLNLRLFRQILGVGLLSAVGTVQVNLTVVLVTAAVGQFGPDAIAGYGIASRLDYIQIPILFGIGTALLTMVGLSIGAGEMARARRIAWTGAALAFAVTAGIGIAALLFPHIWIGLFSDAPEVHAMGVLYIQHVAPVYGAIGGGLALYFASQGAGRVLAPVLAGTVRMILAAFVGWTAVVHYGAGPDSLFQIVALAGLVYGGLTAAAMLLGSWARPADGSNPVQMTTPNAEVNS